MVVDSYAVMTECMWMLLAIAAPLALPRELRSPFSFRIGRERLAYPSPVFNAFLCSDSMASLQTSWKVRRRTRTNFPVCVSLLLYNFTVAHPTATSVLHRSHA